MDFDSIAKGDLPTKIDPKIAYHKSLEKGNRNCMYPSLSKVVFFPMHTNSPYAHAPA